ncbi:MAG: GLUG motif-containing protein [Prevotella sp.]
MCTGDVTQNTAACAVLTADIVVNSNLLANLNADGTVKDGYEVKSWTPIGPYTGTFDGNGKTVSGLYFNDTSTWYVGLFGYVRNSTIKNVGVVDSYFKGSYYVGGVCGYNEAESYEGTMTATITNCYNTGSVSGTSRCVGGVCGENYANSVYGTSTATITNCHNTGSVSGSSEVGGVCGYNWAYSNGGTAKATATITNCYNTGSVSGSKNVGGVCGNNFANSIGGTSTATITNCYYDSEKYAENAVGGGNGTVGDNVTGKTTAQFKGGEVAYLLAQGCTINEISYSGSVWGQTIGTDNYPVLGGDKVYSSSNCLGYSNKVDDPQTGHNYVNGICQLCGGYEPAEQVSETHHSDLNDKFSGYYAIENAGQFYWFADKVNNDNATYGSANAVLTTDIVVNSDLLANLNADGTVKDGYEVKSWAPIGNLPNIYTGTFDGNGKTVSGLYFNDTSTWYVGLFGYVRNSTIKNVGVVDSYFKGGYYVGGVCGWNFAESYEGTMTATITNCYNTGSVSGSYNVGGVCGNNAANSNNGGTAKAEATITNCYNTGIVSGTNSYIGGVCGQNNTLSTSGTATATITNCYNTGSVSGTNSDVGGVCGENYADSYGGTATATITNCYNAGSVSGSSNVGGVCGGNVAESNSGTATATITNCYYNSEKYTGEAVGGGDGTVGDNVTGKTTAQFKGGEVAYLLQSGQTADDYGTIPEVWGQTIGTDNYPVLGGAKVYSGAKNCTGYSNTANDTETGHNYDDNGICKRCGGYEPATLNGDNVYEIGNAGQLYWFAGLVNGTLTDGTSQNTAACAKLTTDIVVNSNLLANLNADGTVKDGYEVKSWTPIGPYTGTFDGNGKTVSGLYFNNTSTDYVGLFGYVQNGTIKNVGVVDSYFKGDNYVGGVCGYNYAFSDGVTLTATITNCYNTGSVSGSAEVGGVCGNNTADSFCGTSEATITNCYNTGSVSGSGFRVGGVCGHNYAHTIVGGTSTSTITNCYNTGSVSGTSSNIGGVCGENYVSSNNDGISATITNCYYLSGCNVGGTIFNGYGTSKSTDEFKSGEVCYLLNGSSPYGAWGQVLGTDGYPVPGSGYKVLMAAQDGENATYWATFSNLDSNVELMAEAVYNATVSGGKLTLTKRSDNRVTAGEGVLLKANSEYVNAKNISDEVSAAAEGDNDLVATPETAGTITAASGYTLYRLTYNDTDTKSGLGFYLGAADGVTDGSQLKATPGKAYLNVLTTAATVPATAAIALGFAFGDDDDTTGIECITITDESSRGNSAKGMFDLQGRKVSKAGKGIYIKNGKKFVNL